MKPSDAQQSHHAEAGAAAAGLTLGRMVCEDDEKWHGDEPTIWQEYEALWSPPGEEGPPIPVLAMIRMDDPYLESYLGRARWRRWAEQARAVAHPGVWPVLHYVEYGEHGAVLVRAAGWDRRASLQRALLERRVLGSEMLPIARQLVAALVAVRRAGLAALTLHPSVILLRTEPGGAPAVCLAEMGALCIEDLGELETRTMESAEKLIFGGYELFVRFNEERSIEMDAEQLERADVNGLGLLLAIGFTGRWPFGDAPLYGVSVQLGELLAVRIHMPPVAIATLCPEMPPALAALIDRMLSWEPSARPLLAEVEASLGAAELEVSWKPAPKVRDQVPGASREPSQTPSIWRRSVRFLRRRWRRMKNGVLALFAVE